MKKSSMIFRIICMAVCFALCISVLPVMAEEAVVEEGTVVEETVDSVTDEAAEEMTDVEENVEESTDEVIEESSEEFEENFDEELEEEEVLTLFAATLRDGGIYVTPGEYNDTPFTLDNIRYRVRAGVGNSIKVDGFESGVDIESEVDENAKYRLQANAEITTEAAHSGYFGLSVSTGQVIYRAPVSEGQTYVFSAWMKVPEMGSVSETGRAYYVTSDDTGNSYIVGYNEIGRDVEWTGKWQQVIFTFTAPETGLFAIDFKYSGKEVLYLDDIELYEVEVFVNPLVIKSITSTDANGNSFTRDEGFSTRGVITHTTEFYNEDEDDVEFAAVWALYRNDIMIDFGYSLETALVLDTTEVTLEIEIPEEGKLSEYKYLVYFVSDSNPTHLYGKTPTRTNPYVAKGN